MIDYKKIDGFIQTEPRIELIHNILNQILQLVDLEKDGEIVDIDGFRLKNLDVWTTTVSNAWDSINSLTSRCNCSCKFCYLKGDGPIRIGNIPMVSFNEALTRFKHFEPKTGKSVISEYTNYGEPLINPNLFNILEEFRKLDRESPIDLTTNGIGLTEEVLRQLEKYHPIQLSISVNSMNPDKRFHVMRDHTSGRNLFEYLRNARNYGILIYSGSIVAWPEMTLEDIEASIYALDELNIRQIRVHLPGYTKYFTEDQLFDLTYWDQVVDLIEKTRQKIKTPLFASPYLYYDQSQDVKIHGIIRNSPAEKAGLRPGDIVLEVNGRPVQSRSILNYLLTRNGKSLSDHRRVIKILRDGQEQIVNVIDLSKREDDLYPFKPQYYYNPSSQGFGIVVMDDFDENNLEQLKELILHHQSESPVIFSSIIIQPILQSLLQKRADEFCDCQLQVEVPEHKTLGGNIVVGDLYMIDDFIAHLTLLKQQGREFDLVLIPSSMFVGWGRDLMGVSYKKIENIFNVPVEIVQCKKILT